jgi:hypothetical protein
VKDLYLEINGSPVIVSGLADAEGFAIVNGRMWRWEFSKRTGPLFLRADGEPRVRWPGEKHPVWRAVKKWQRRNGL